MTKLSLLVVCLFFLLATSAFATVAGRNLLDNKKLEVASGQKGTVLVFLSAQCPCSNSHVPVLKKMAEDFKDFSFVAIHSNLGEDAEAAKAYFTEAKLPFPVIEDEKLKLADKYKAKKTPHAFLLDPMGKVIYRGGVTNSSDAAVADKIFLRDALADVHDGKPVRLAEGKTFGCAISRK